MASQTRSGRFQVGDKVQLAVTGRRGRVAGVGAADSPFYYVQWDDQPDGWASVKGDQLEPISRPEPVRRSINTEQSDVVVDDSVNRPAHYTRHPSGIEAIDITEHFGFCLGNAIKYIWRADYKGNPIKDLEKAAWYVNREIERRKNLQSP